MFLNNKYSKYYFDIITKAKQRVNYKNHYMEIHHIIPRSLGGSNLESNLVSLSAREHFICHLLLTKMTTGIAKRSMCYAMWTITKIRHSNLEKIKINSYTYAYVREKYAQTLSSSKLGIPRSQETREKISKSKLGRKNSIAHNEAISKGAVKRKPASQETREKISKVHKGKILSKETKEKVGRASLNRHQSSGCKWALQDPHGNIYNNIVSLNDFCKTNNLPWKSISLTLKSNIPVSKGIAKGWIVISKIKNKTTLRQS